MLLYNGQTHCKSKAAIVQHISQHLPQFPSLICISEELTGGASALPCMSNVASISVSDAVAMTGGWTLSASNLSSVATAVWSMGMIAIGSPPRRPSDRGGEGPMWSGGRAETIVSPGRGAPISSGGIGEAIDISGGGEEAMQLSGGGGGATGSSEGGGGAIVWSGGGGGVIIPSGGARASVTL